MKWKAQLTLASTHYKKYQRSYSLTLITVHS